MGDHVDPQARRVAARDAALEQLDLGRDVGEQRVERLVENLEPRDLGVVQIDHDAGTLGHVDARLAHRLLEPGRARLGVPFRHAVPSLSASAGTLPTSADGARTAGREEGPGQRGYVAAGAF